MLTLDFDGSELVLTGSSPLDKDIAVSINGVRAEGAKRWLLPASVPCWLESVDVVTSDGGEVTDRALQILNEHILPGARNLISTKNAAYPPARLGSFTLKEKQEQCAQFLASVGSGAITSDMRTGKTLVIFRVLELKNAFPALITTLPNTTGEIAKQARAAFPDKKIIVIGKNLTAPQRKKLLNEGADIYIMGHNLVELHAKFAWYGGIPSDQHKKEVAAGKYEPKELDSLGLKAVVVDEGHAIENRKAAVTRAIWNLADHTPTRIVATGTIAANGDEALWCHLRFLFPKVFPARGKFLKRYLNMVENRFGRSECRPINVVGSDGIKRLSGIKPERRADWNLIWDLISVRVERTEGPEKEYRAVPVELDKKSLKAYQDMARHGLAEFGDELVTATDSMSVQHRLTEFASATPVLRDGKVISLQMPSAKVDALLDILNETDDKAIVVSSSRLLADLILSVLDEKSVTAVSLLGGMSDAAQARAEDEFNSGAAKVIVINQAGAFGKELPAAKRTIFMQRSFDYRFSSQAEARNTSAAQESTTVEVIDIFAQGTLDEAVFEAFASKDSQLHERLRDKDWVERHLNG